MKSTRRGNSKIEVFGKMNGRVFNAFFIVKSQSLSIKEDLEKIALQRNSLLFGH